MRRRALVLALLAALPAQAQSPPPGAAGNPVAGIPLSSLSATRERPLFAPTRRPPAPPPAPAAPAAEPAPAVAAPAPTPTLIGAVIGPEGRMAVIGLGDGPPLRLREGQSQAGWRLRSVEARAVVVENEGRLLRLELPSTAPAAAGVASPASPVARARGDGAAEP